MSRVAILSAIFFGLLLLDPTPAAAQEAPSELSEEATISMLTILPGDEIHSEFGHSAFRVHDPVHEIDWTYDYGTFDFTDPYFLPKFLYGQLDYFLAVSTYAASERHYRQKERPIIEQTLNLTHEQRNEVFQFLQWNAQPENRTYRYDFLFDNCSTRIRDVLEQTLGDEVSFAAAPAPNESFRHLLKPYVDSRPLVNLGFDLGLGTPTDREATAREFMFLPIPLMDAFDEATVEAGGSTDPLVAETDTLLWVDGYEATPAALDWPFWLAWAVALIGIGAVARNYARQEAPSPWPDVGLLTLVGVIGVTISFLWFIAEHEVTNYNWNLLWAWPTHLIAAIMLARSYDPRKILSGYLAIAAGFGFLTLAGWLWWPQDFHPTAFPIVLVLTVRLAWQAFTLAEDPSQLRSTADPVPAHS